ncbi:MAG: SDR family oxidoreductase [Holophaga sp.]|nr:SDR family oxidoreductase [Holophaga sp.]
MFGRLVVHDWNKSGCGWWKELLVSLHAQALFSLEGKTVLLTGAAGFLGRTMGETLLVNGARLIALGRSERLLVQLECWKARFGEKRVRACQVDMYNVLAFEKVLDEIVASEPRIDVLVNNAHELGPNTGFNTPEGSLESSTHDQWMRNLTGGVYWAALSTQKAGTLMQRQQSGSIINISTMYATVAPDPKMYKDTPFSNPPGYSASKAALEAFTRYTASYWGKHGIRANSIAPGPFSNTEDKGTNSVKTGDPFLERLKARTCLDRIGRPEELAGVLLFLASEASSYMTGQIVLVDGGWTVR